MVKNDESSEIMELLTVRPARTGDLARILEIYETAKAFMRANGNPTQWSGSYPQRELLEEDIAAGHLFAVTEQDTVHGVFAFILGDDPTYAIIEQGSWRSNTPYGTIHRVASDGSGGILRAALDYAAKQSHHLRIDTHADNAPMQHLVAKYGFSRRGIIYTDDGTPRLAYDRIEVDG